MATLKIYGVDVEDSACPGCGQPGRPAAVTVEHSTPPASRVRGRQQAVLGFVTGARTFKLDWQCSQCMCAWETEELEGQPSSRRTGAASVSLSRPFFPGAQPHALWTPAAAPEEPSAPEPEQTIHGSVIGYRAWRIQDWQLFGTGVNRAWVPGVNEATCDAGSGMMTFGFGGMSGTHPAPAIGCHCGITALARFAEHDTHWPDDCIRGAIEAWSDETAVSPGEVADAAGVETGVHPEPGRFILHGTGFRAQFGKIVLLAVDPEWPSAKRAAVRALAAEHEADVCRPSHLEDAAKEHGQLVPDELLKWAAEGEPAPTEYGASLLAAHVTGGSNLAQVMQQMQWAIQQSSVSMFSLRAALQRAPKRTKGPRPTGKKGISQTLGYPGPPADPTSKFSKGQRVRDSKGVVWACVKGGKPGLWEAEGEGR